MSELKYMTLEEIQNAEKQILSIVADFCEEHSLRYYLAYGTLLGAVRHKDIIPWDKDIDIFMPRPDFEKFLELTQNSDIKENIKSFSWKNTKGYYLPWIKVCDMSTRLVITRTTSKIPFGVWIDIFPLDGIPADKNEEEKLKTIFKNGVKDCLLSVSHMSLKEKIFNFKRLSPIRKYGQGKIMNDISEAAAKTDYDSSEYIADLEDLQYNKSMDEIKIEHSVYDETTDIELGGRKYKCPKDYDYVLRKTYGNYMELPPEDKRIVPNFRAYWV